jgi:hypothetical protein
VINSESLQVRIAMTDTMIAKVKKFMLIGALEGMYLRDVIAV